MKTKKKSSIIRLAGVALAAVICSGIAAVSSLTVKADNTDINAITATMDKGASVRLPANANYSDIGIRYTYFVSENDYAALQNAGYESLAYGVFIAPNYYNEKHAINDETSLNAYYYWGNAEAQNGKAFILNVEKTELAKDLVHGYRFDGAVVNMLEENLLTEYIGVGYIKYTVNGETHYKFAESNDNARSMVYIAQCYIEDKGDNAQALNAYFNDTVTATDTTYTVEHLVKQGDGTYKLYGEAESVTAKVNGTATATAKTDIPHYTYEKGDLSGVVYANGKRTLKLYYTFAVPEDEKVANKGLVESTAMPKLSTGFISGLNLKLYKVLGSTETEVENFKFESNGNIDITKLSGTYVARACAGEEVIQTVTFDAYSKNDKFEWNNDLTTATYSHNQSYGANPDSVSHTIENTVVSEAYGRTGSYIKTEFTPKGGATEGAQGFIYLKPVHSVAYYELYSNSYLTFDYYFDTTAEGEITSRRGASCIRMKKGVIPGDDSVTYRSGIYNNVWQTAKIPVSYLIENYEQFVKAETERLETSRKFIVGFESYIAGKASGDAWINHVTSCFGNLGVDLNLKVTADANITKAILKTETLNAVSLLSEENAELANEYAPYVQTVLTDNDGKESVYGTTVDLSALESGAYAISVKIAATQLIGGYIFVYENGETPVWNTVGLNEKNGYGDYFCNEGGNNDLANISMVTVETLSEDNAVGGKTSGSFYKMNTEKNSAQEFHFVLRPIFERSVYSTYLGQHANAKLVFDVFVAPADGFVHNKRQYTINGQSGNKEFTVNTWHTLETALSTLVTNYDSLYTRTTDNKSWIFGIAGSYTAKKDGVDYKDTTVLTVYIGNFRIVSGD